MSLLHARFPRYALAMAVAIVAGLPAVAAPTLQERVVAATRTARSDTNSCFAARPFYWEVGGASQAQASGSVDAEGDPTTYTPDSWMNLGSVTKWLFAAYVVERNGGALSDDELAKLQHRSGYVSMGKCYPGQTVGSCYRYQDNDVLTPSAVGVFEYDGGHMQRLAMDLGLGPLKRRQLAAEVKTKLGARLPIGFSVPMPSGGGSGTPAGVATFLRKLMNDNLLLGAMLGSHAVCTNPLTCGSGEAAATPIPSQESWTYSLGHWVESDPVVGDGSFSSSGTLGFYPWISANRTSYGIVAREVDAGNAWPSVQCGRQIRKAWQTGAPQLEPAP